MDLRLDRSERDGWTVLSVGGEIDIATAPHLREKLLEIVNEQRYRIVADLADVDFIDSTGLGVLIGALKRVRTHDGELRVVCIDPRTLKVFQITGLDRVFSLVSSVEEATTT